MTLRHMKIFVTVCECMSITKASEKLNFTQPAVSLAIKELENYYGIKLFDRISRKLFITEAGKEFLRYARQIVSLFDEMEKGIKNWDSFGLLRIGSSITIGTCLIPGYVNTFSKIYPKINLKVTIDNSSVIENKILNNELDFALIEGLSHSDYIISKSFLADELVLVCGARHKLSKETEITLERLATEKLILREKGSGTREILDSTFLTHGIIVVPTFESISTEAIKSAVSSGIGVSVLPYKLVSKELENHDLIKIKITNVEFKRNFHIIYHKDKHLSKSAMNFISMCKGNFPENKK